MIADARTAARGWLDAARVVPLADVACALGLAVNEVGGRAVALSPCPACAAVRRHPRRGDRRGAIGLTRDAGGWRCHECEARGDALDLVAVALRGARLRELAPRDSAAVADWYASYGWGPVTRGTDASWRTPSPPPARPPTPPPRPPTAEVAALWSACRSVSDDAEVAAWLAGRGLDAGQLADRDLARALPQGLTALPRWATCRACPWTEGWRLLLPLHDAAGKLASVRARLIRKPGAASTPKSSAAAAGPGSSAGLVMADRLGRQVLNWGHADRWCSGGRLHIFVAEGEPDYLALACLWSDADDETPAVLGIVAGAWTPAIAARIPDDTIVTIATDPDDAGDRYARDVAATLADRCDVRRWRAREMP